MVINKFKKKNQKINLNQTINNKNEISSFVLFDCSIISFIWCFLNLRVINLIIKCVGIIESATSKLNIFYK